MESTILSIVGTVSMLVTLWTLLYFHTDVIKGWTSIFYQATLLTVIAGIFLQIFSNKQKKIGYSVLLLLFILWEVFFFKLESNEFRIGYSSQFIASTYLLFLAKPKLTEIFSIIVSKKTFLVAFFGSIYLFSVWITDGFTTPYAKNVLRQEISTWFLSGWDQSCYYKMTQQIASGEWFPQGYKSGYYYGLGYPLLASIFYYVYPANPFLLLNISLFIGAAVLFYRTSQSQSSNLLAFIATFLLLTQTPINNWSKDFMLTNIMPWTNIISVMASLLFLYYLFGKKSRNNRVYFLLGLTYGLLFATRYGDILYFLPLAIAILIKDIPLVINFLNLKRVITRGLFFSLGTLLLLIPTLISHKVFYGDYLTTYLEFAVTGPRKTFFSALFDLRVHFFKFLELFLYPDIAANESYRLSGMLASIPIVLLFFYGLKLSFKEDKLVTVLCGMFMLTNIVFFTATGATSAIQIKYYCLRYFTPILPFLVFFSFKGITHAVRYSNSSIGTNVKWGVSIFCMSFLVLFSLTDKPIYILRSWIRPPVTLDVDYTGKKDFAAKKAAPNLVKDGEDDLQFDLKIKSFYPIYVIRTTAVALDQNGETWVTSRYKLKSDKNLWGVGLLNPYGKELAYKYTGDNHIYENFFLPKDKDLKAFLPTAHEITGRIKFTIETNRGRIEDIVEIP